MGNDAIHPLRSIPCDDGLHERCLIYGCKCQCHDRDAETVDTTAVGDPDPPAPDPIVDLRKAITALYICVPVSVAEAMHEKAEAVDRAGTGQRGRCVVTISIPLWVFPVLLVVLGMLLMESGKSGPFGAPDGRQLVGCLLLIVTVAATLGFMLAVWLR